MTDNVKVHGNTSRARPGKYQDNTEQTLQLDRYGEVKSVAMLGAKLHALSDEGAYFTACNPTPLTGIAGITAADGLDDLEALIFLRNGENADGKRVYLDFIELDVITGVGTNGTNINFAMKLDKGNSRYASGGSAITPKNANMDDTTASIISQLYFGAVVPTAATADARLVYHARMRTVIKVLGDKYRFEFGASGPSPMSGIPTDGTLQACITKNCPPLIIGPQQSFLLHEFASSQTVAATYQFQMGWWER